MRNLPVRKPNRLRNYDYSQNGAYFITICAKDKHELFGKIKNGKPLLNEYGCIVKQEIENIQAIRKECVVHTFIVMPNHIHLIVEIVTVGDDGNRPADGNNSQAGDNLQTANNLQAANNSRADRHPPVRFDGNRPADGNNSQSGDNSQIANNLQATNNSRADRHPPVLRKSISNMVQGLKGAVSRKIEFSPWQRSFHDHIIRNEEDYHRIVRYIEDNPSNWEADYFYETKQ